MTDATSPADRVEPPSGPSQAKADAEPTTLLDRVMYFCLKQKVVVVLLTLAIVAAGIYTAPFDWDVAGMLRSPVPVDAIPDIGENQQIVFTEWMGRSPQDVEDQITYPLTVALLGIPEVKTIRSYSFFGFSSIYVIFNERAEFYWSRSRVLEKLNSLPAGTLPEGVQPALGPDATALGQIFWYTLEGRDPDGQPIGGFDLHELRSIQDWTVRYALASAEGISEVASVGGFVLEYQIDVDPDAMRAHGVTLNQIYNAVRMSNVDVGARTIEVNRAEYIVRGLGFIKRLEDIEKIVLKSSDNVPIAIKDVAHVTIGPALRRGALDKGGAESVGGVVVVRYGYNPLQAIKNVKAKIAEIEPGLPTHVVFDWDRVSRTEIEQYATRHGFEAFDESLPNHDAWTQHLRSIARDQWPAWANLSQVKVVPFYDRTGLIYETLGTLNKALLEEILVTILVIIISVWHLRSSLLISSLLPLAVLMCFIAMKLFGVDANIVALSGIAIAIGTMVDMGIVLCENILKHLDEAAEDENRLHVVYRASSEVGSAVLTAVSTTVVGFLPVFTMTGPEGKLFRPLAFTKTFALIASVIVALTIIPPAAHLLFTTRLRPGRGKRVLSGALAILGAVAAVAIGWYWMAGLALGWAAYLWVADSLSPRWRRLGPVVANAAAFALVIVMLSDEWSPLGPDKGVWRNLVFVFVLIGGLLAFFQVFQYFIYAPVLRWALRHKLLFLSAPLLLLVAGLCAWLGFANVFSFVPAVATRIGIGAEKVTQSVVWQWTSQKFPGLGREFMPPLDEGSFLYMPTTMPHASIGEALDVLQLQNQAISAIPEVDLVVGKLGRVESPLDPAPISMIETVISYKPEYAVDKDGHRIKYRFDVDAGQFVRDESGNLIEDPHGRPFRLWRDHIRSPDDIWKEITRTAQVPGTTSAPKLQPIAARIVMLQSGMRAPMGIKVRGPDLETIERVSLELERFLKQVPSVEASAVIADRIVGKPYIEIDIDRDEIQRYGLHIRSVQDVIEVAIGGKRITTTVEGRERYPVRVRYMRELRNQIETLGRILVPTPDGVQIPLEQLAEIRYVRGPQVLKSEDTFLLGYVLFDKKPEFAEVDVVEDCQRFLQQKIESGELVLPAGVSYRFAGNYENQIRSQKTLALILPIALFVIFMILYLNFRSVMTAGIVFSGIGVAWAGGFLMIWLYAQPWFLNFSVFETDIRELFQIHAINLSVAVWVGFLALFGIASDDGVVIGTYLDQSFRRLKIETAEDARHATLLAGRRRVRPALMTTATTVLALIPVLTSTGRGSDIMVPMAIPSFGGMTVEVLTMFVVPVLFCAIQEWKLRLGIKDERFAEHAD
ncbi:MAG: cation transporter [Pirellulaceae bacterium]|nr:MAG: cation transporter [Pirellulaceae bacterium]